MDICITGVSRGLGLALTRQLLSEGHRVWGVARSAEGLEALTREFPDRFQGTPIDIADDANLCSWVSAMECASFVPNIVVLNASVQLNDMEGSYDHARGESVLRVNLNGALRCVSLFLPQFLARRSGAFVAVCSTVALRPSVRSASYAASKAGLAMAFRTLRLRYAPKGVRFAVVFLGPIATEMWEGGKSSLVPPPEHAARKIASFLFSPSSILYYPPLSTLLLRCAFFLPDRLFSSVSTMLLKK